jgi:hypothetical protein
MRKSYTFVVMAMICLFGMGSIASAQDPEIVVVSVPFEFVAAGRTMPAGTYRISRLSLDVHSGLIISGQGSGALVLPIAVDDASAPQPAALSFDRVGEKYILTKVETTDHAYTFAVPRGMTMSVQVKDRVNAVSAGSK